MFSPRLGDSSAVSVRFALGAILLIEVGFLRSAFGISCLDDDLEPIDHFVGLTTPESSDYYAVFDGSDFQKGAIDLQSDPGLGGSIYGTIAQLYNLSSATGYAMYNDEPPPSKTESSTYAHAKGVIAVDETMEGFIMVHSKPHWPNAVADGASPFPDFTYGQSFICVTVDSTTIEEISTLLTIDYPYVYDSDMPSSLLDSFPNLSGLMSKAKSDVSSSTFDFSSKLTGAKFRMFAKSRDWSMDLYADLVAPSLGSDMYVETWRDGSGGLLPSFCTNSTGPRPTDYNIYSVNEVVMPDGTSWKGTKDHSKWAVSSGAACVGDINRFCSQESRGGGTLCIFDEQLAKALQATVGGVDECWDRDPCTYSCYWCTSSIE